MITCRFRKNSASRQHCVVSANRTLMFLLLLVITISYFSPLTCCAATDKWSHAVSKIVWVAYSPSKADPPKKVEASPDQIRKDLLILWKAGFSGLVTYGSQGHFGQDIPGLAKAANFEGIIMGIWDPVDEKEMANAISAGEHPIVLGYCVGNEGLGTRYDFDKLSEAVKKLQKKTGKPVTTTEQCEDYSDSALLNLGDWVFPNVHPYFHNKTNAASAVHWTQTVYDDLKKRTTRFILFKEVGFPTSGDPSGKMSERLQEQYYLSLAKTNVPFVYFEGFDQPWKTHLPIEPYWGIFRADGRPKRLATYLMKKTLPKNPFYVYHEAGSNKNHSIPSGFMGDTGDIEIDEAFQGKPRSGDTCIKITYKAQGTGPQSTIYSPAKWAGVYWQEPENNWGTNPQWKDKGFNLAGYDTLSFWGRADKMTQIEFKVGGINEKYGDSLKYPRSINARLSTEWKQFEIKLNGADLSSIIGPFCWATNWDKHPRGVIFYLDDIRFDANE